ncbi:peptidylprolyl isomerase [Kiloniella sp.]|uniref:peptidylprolyl isomerase n=1 Tax=Kiloniella sp. TaxID=1938587 RepID=UPI003B018797
MTSRRISILAVALFIALSFSLPVTAEPEKDDADKIEQRKSGGNLLKFIFGDEEETDDETENPDPEEKQPKELNSEEAKPLVPPKEEGITTEELGGASLPSAVNAPIVQETTEQNEPIIIPGQAREGLAPPPGFTEEAPEDQPGKTIVVEQLPASSTTSSASTVKGVVVSQEDTAEEATPEATELSRLAKENPVVAIVEGDRIYWQDIMQAARKLPEQYQGQLETMFPLLLDRAIDLKLLAHAGADADVDRNDEVKRKLALAEEQIIRDAYLEQQLDEMISESMLKERYFALLRDNITNAEIRARHILVDTRNEALALIIALENGAEFPLLAKKFSRGPSSGKGGDLGWFRRKDMDPEFAVSAFELKRGEFTKTPVSTEFGWHVIKLEDKREVKQPTFEAMRGEIKEMVSRDLVAVMVRDLRKEADISVFPAK